MKKVFMSIKLPDEEPDRCIDCPLLGLLPKDERPFGRQQSHICLGTAEGISGRMTKRRKSDKDCNHTLDRPCKGDLWQIWQESGPNPGYMQIRVCDYFRYRQPQINSGQLLIKFRKPRNKSK